MPTGHSHLVKRGARYWFRRRLPAPLGRALGVPQLRRSLGIRRRRPRAAPGTPGERRG